MAATAGHRLTLDRMGKCSNAFFIKFVEDFPIVTLSVPDEEYSRNVL
jgi:hypothetical protein